MWFVSVLSSSCWQFRRYPWCCWKDGTTFFIVTHNWNSLQYSNSLLFICIVTTKERGPKYSNYGIVAFLVSCMIHARSHLQVNGELLGRDRGTQIMKGWTGVVLWNSLKIFSWLLLNHLWAVLLPKIYLIHLQAELPKFPEA